MKTLFLSIFTLVICLGSFASRADESVKPVPQTKQEDKHKLVDDAQEKVAKHPKDAEAHFELASANLKAEDWQKGLQAMDQAIQLNPNVAKYHATRAVLTWANEEFEASYKSWKRALELEPQNANYWFSLAESKHVAHWFMEQKDDGRAEFEKVLAINPKHVSALYYSGQIQRKAKKDEQAKAFFQKAIELDQQNQPLANKFVHQKPNLPGDELTLERQAVLLGPTDRQEAHANLIQIFESEGKTKERDAYLNRIYAQKNGDVSDGDFCRDYFKVEGLSFSAHEAFANNSPIIPKYRFSGFASPNTQKNYRLIAVPRKMPAADPADKSTKALVQYRHEFQQYQESWFFTQTRIYKVFDTQPSYEEVKALLQEVELGNVKPIQHEESN
ncbi:MAG: tetratricopeptide repeat protein [Planctomycetaceae bacterium]